MNSVHNFTYKAIKSKIMKFLLSEAFTNLVIDCTDYVIIKTDTVTAVPTAVSVFKWV